MPGTRDWLETDKPSDLLRYAQTYTGANHARALKFFAVHACRLAVAAMPDSRSTTALDTAERHLVGLATADELAAVLLDANAARQEVRAAYEVYAADPATRSDHRGRAERMSNSLGAHVAFTVAHIGFYDGLFAHVRDALAFRHHKSGPLDRAMFRMDLCRILREVVANPFRRPEFAPEWRTETVVLLAREMLAANDFGAMPILADALQDAGCDADAVLNHCRNTSQVHLRGCWVLELVLSSA